MRKLSILIFLMFTLLLSGTSQALSVDVTSPGDAIKGYPDDGDWPAGEAPLYVIDDNPGTKFLHFKGDNETSGFQVTAALGGKVVTGISLVTGNDAPERDPVVVEISGSNVGIDGPYTPIATVTVDDFDQVDPWPRNAKNATPITFANAVAYDHYQVLFTVIRLPENGCCMQVSEVELLADVTPPAGWGLKNIGNPGIPGSAVDDAGTWTVRGSGHDVWGNADGIYYVFRPMSGDGSLQVNLQSMDLTSGWAKVGPAIRETLGAGSKHAMTAMTGSNGIQFVWRVNTNQGSDGVQRAGELPPKELRITRAGDDMISEFNYEWLPGLFMWTEIARMNIPMATDTTIGVVVCATNNGALNKAVLDNIILTTAAYEKPWAMSPDDGATRVSLMPTLSWMPGDSAASHDVYLGLEGAMTLVSSQAVGNESYTPGAPLLGNTKYEWQVVEQPGDVAGPVYSFTTLYEAPWYAGTLNSEQWTNLWWPEVMRMVDSAHYLQDPADAFGEVTDARYGGDTPVVDYGVRLSGHLIPGTSGDYTFWVAADDGCILALNTNPDVAELDRIAWHYRYSGNPDANPEQKSVPIYLEAGQNYAIEILLKEAGGGDWVEAWWEGPDTGGVRTRISGDFLTSAYAVNARPDINIRRNTITLLEATKLTWTAGKFATSQEVLFGTSPGAMASIATLPANPAVLAEHCTLAMPAVAAGNTYYWQVISTDGTDTWVGDVWSFTVSEWVHRNIGIDPTGEDAPEPPLGYSTYDPVTDTTVIGAGGHELWGDNDEFAYRYTTVKMTRDTGMIQARVLSIQPADSWRRGGVMIRENLGVGSRKVMMHKTGENNLRMQYRQNHRAGTGSTADNRGLPWPMWVRLTRDNNRFEGYFSEDGENWNHVGGVDVPMALDKLVYIGLAQCHHPGVDQSTLTTGTFDSFSYTTPDIKQSWNLQPPDGATMVDIHATLSWGAGEGVTEHRVYFSADEEAVVNRTVAPIVLPAETTSVQVGPLMMGQVYYWCVDEVINPVTPGEVISFTAETYRTIDDFEAYDVEPEPLPEQLLIPGEILVEAVPPPDQAWIEPETIVLGSDDGPQIVDDPARGLVLALDGDGDYVDCGNPAALNFGTGDWTLSAWVKNTMTGTGDSNKGSIIANGGDSGGGKRYCLVVSESDEGRVTLVTDDNSKKRTAKGATMVNDGVWHHVLGVRDGGTMRLYVDGVEDASSSINEDLSGTVQHNLYLGCITDAPDDDKLYKFYEGLIDDAQIYDYALSTDNIAFLADKGGTAPATGPLANWAFEGDFTDSSGNGYDGTPMGAYEDTVEKIGYYGPLIAHYAFDEGSGNVAVDSSGNGLDGVISGAVYSAITADGSASCLDFNGFGDNVLNSLAGPYLNHLDELSVSMWIQSDEIASDKGFFMGSASASDRHGIRYDSKGGSADPDGNDVIKYGVRTYEGNEEDESSQFVQTTEWQHVVVTWKSGVGLKLWLNANIDGPTFDAAAQGGLTDGYDRLWVGKGSKDMAADAGWDGRIDDVRVYARTLSEGEVRYLAGVGNIALPDTYQPLIGHWTADGHADDSSGNENHGTPLGDATIVGDPERGLVGTFDGDGDAIDVGNSELFNFQDDATISVWVNLNSWNGSWGNCIIGKRGEGGVGWQLRRFSGENRFSWTTRGMGNDDYPASNLAINMNQWYHLAAVRDGTEKRLYINGNLDSTQGINANPITPCPHNVYIGARANGGNTGPEAFFDGMIDELRVYNMALTWPQILTLAENVPTNPLSATWSGRAGAAPALQWQGGAHEGTQAMRVEYTGSGAVTRLEPFGDGKHPHGWNGDFSLGGAQALSLWFKGDPDNAPGTLFAQLTTVVPSGHTQRVLYNGDPEDLMTPDWKEWNISLKELSTGKPADPIEEMGLPITKIKDVGIGVIGAGAGVVYFDDLRLYPVRCVPEYGPAKDLDGDCDVDEADLRELIGDYLWQDNPGEPGVRYEYFEDAFDGLNDLDARAAIPMRVGVKANFDISGHRGDNFGYRFSAKIAAPEGGYYTFYTSSDDGSKLYVDGIQVVDNDGFHGMQWREGVKYLTAGLHDIVVTMFEAGGGEGLLTEVAGPGIPRMPIPNEVLFLPDAPKADLNGDGIVNFLDYADILNSYVDEILWPGLGELL